LKSPSLKIQKVSDVLQDVLEKRWPQNRLSSSELADYVNAIIDEVKGRGDTALIDFTLKLDGVNLSPERLQVGREEVQEAYERVSQRQISAIEFAKERLETSESDLLSRFNIECKYESVRLRRIASPIRSVGCYVPGGEASYPSTLVMTTVSAKVARVPRVVVCSPPKSGGVINPLTLVAADICEVDEIYRIGGVQAIAALAYGTETIRPVEKIVGPGNKYVLAAKMLVSRDVPIDLPAGPSEILILADDSSDPWIVTLDMISQAEHGVDAVSVLITTSSKIAEAVVEALNRLVASSSNTETVGQALSRNGMILTSENMAEAVDFINEFAPEHLELMVKDPWNIAEKITSAGLVLIGSYTPVAASDYCLGTNHVLPTGGFSRVFSGLSVLDFVRLVSIVECSKEGLLKIRENVSILAESERLTDHALAVEGRFKVE